MNSDLINRNIRSMIFAVVTCLIYVTGCKPGRLKDVDAKDKIVYTCTMHPEVIRMEMGQCPICGMDLIPVPAHHNKIDSLSADILLKPTNSYVVSDVKTVKPSLNRSEARIEVSGVISYDASLINTVSARVNGRIEKLYVKYPYQLIKKGQRLFDLYSPELLNEQQNFIYLLKNEVPGSGILTASENRLSLLGFNDAQIEEIKSMRRVIDPLPYFSPFSGHLHANITASIPGTMSGDGMAGGATSPTVSTLSLKEGVYVNKGETIFQVNGTSTVWCLLNLSGHEVDMVKEGDTILVRANDRIIQARADFIEPVFRDGQYFVSVRAYLNNSDNSLKIGESVTGILTSPSSRGVFLPSTAIVSLGLRKVVFLQDAQVFKAHEITTGKILGNMTEVFSGLDSTSIVAQNAQFLIDSESFIKTYE